MAISASQSPAAWKPGWPVAAAAAGRWVVSMASSLAAGRGRVAAASPLKLRAAPTKKIVSCSERLRALSLQLPLELLAVEGDDGAQGADQLLDVALPRVQHLQVVVHLAEPGAALCSQSWKKPASNRP
jgi:hypothetical protein